MPVKLHISKRRLLRTTAGVLAAAAVFYASEDLSLRLHIPASHRVFSQIPVQSFDAVKLKNGRTEFYFDPPQTVACVNAVLPHMGYATCWYVRRHATRRTDIDPSIKTIFPQ